MPLCTIEYRTAGIGGYTVLADERGTTGLGDSISGYHPQLAKEPQHRKLYQSALPFIQDRGNGTWTVAFTVDRQHASPDAALLFIVQHGLIWAAVTNWDLRVTVGAQQVYFPNCALTRLSPDPHSDQSTKISYEFHSPQYTTTPP